MTFDYKKYSLENLENWIHDAMSSGEASPQEIYDAIKGVVDENYHLHKKKTGEAYELLALLNGNGEGHISSYPVSKVEEKLKTPIQQNPQYTDEELDAMCVDAEEEEGYWIKRKTWMVKLEVDGLSGDAIIPIPYEVEDIVGWDINDEIEWIDNKDGSYILRKVTK